MEMMKRTRRHSLKGPILLSWLLIWFGTILIANPERATTQVGVALWGVGILIQYGMTYIWFIGRPSSGATAARSKRRVPASV